jgi:hypothetical protein
MGRKVCAFIFPQHQGFGGSETWLEGQDWLSLSSHLLSALSAHAPLEVAGKELYAGFFLHVFMQVCVCVCACHLVIYPTLQLSWVAVA